MACRIIKAIEILNILLEVYSENQYASGMKQIDLVREYETKAGPPKPTIGHELTTKYLIFEPASKIGTFQKHVSFLTCLIDLTGIYVIVL